MTSSAAWEDSRKRWVLPPDADPDEPDNLVPASDYGRPEAERELAEKVDAQGVQQYVEDGEAVATDGGTPDDQDDDDQDDDQDDAENRFECPNCGTENTGFPATCPECGVSYDWPDDAQEA